MKKTKQRAGLVDETRRPAATLQKDSDRISTHNRLLSFSNINNIYKDENPFTPEGILICLVSDITNLIAENRSTRKSIFILQRQLLHIEALLRKKGGDY